MTIKRTGTVEPIPGSSPTRYRGRLRLGDNSRPRDRVPEPLCYDEDKAAAYVLKLQALEDAKGLLLAKKLGAAPEGETVGKWFARYFAWRKGRGFVVQRDVETRLRRYVVDRLASKLMTAVTRDDIESIVGVLDASIAERTRYCEEADEDDEDEGGRKPGLSWKTALNAWSDITCACASSRRIRPMESAGPTAASTGEAVPLPRASWRRC